MKKDLFDVTAIDNMTMKNRFVRASVGDHTLLGQVTDQVVDRYHTLAEGGVGTILTGFTLIDESERNMNILSMYDDSFITPTSKIAETVHANGANILMQLVYVGSGYRSSMPPVGEILGPSAVANLNNGIVPKAMTYSDIQKVIDEFAAAAVRAKKAGFDGIELHASHGYLLHQFATEYYNRRTDEYGGSLENRYRLTFEVYRAVRKAVGSDFQIWIKLQSQDGFEGGITPESCIYACQILDVEGIDAIEISGNFTAFRQQSAYFEATAAKVASSVKAPVIVTGGNRVYATMEQMINDTDISYVGMARPLISQPDLINKFCLEHIAKSRCVSCNKCLTAEHISRCILNK